MTQNRLSFVAGYRWQCSLRGSRNLETDGPVNHMVCTISFDIKKEIWYCNFTPPTVVQEIRRTRRDLLTSWTSSPIYVRFVCSGQWTGPISWMHNIYSHLLLFSIWSLHSLHPSTKQAEPGSLSLLMMLLMRDGDCISTTSVICSVIRVLSLYIIFKHF